ncbi:DUF2637 domain-containing protein [Actinomadura atramentaria]|uniref:DUF2637 domain-containing protein n=1 Tax=Actinomadura atramentaria TaxID=1990 RepID=UPI000360633E|nr:DUF2637 domain-containing protein [Actinomadura atramentaria]
MSWDVRSERITARAAADKASAEAENLRARTALELQRARAEDARAERAERRREHAERRAERTARRTARRAAAVTAVRTHGALLPSIAAIGAPAVIAWRGQLAFALDQMHLGVLAPLMPVAIEGGVLYSALLTHRAVAADVPSLRYRVQTWIWAVLAAAMNFWNGRSEEQTHVGVALALTSLASIVLLESTVALRKALEGKARHGRDLAHLRRALIRRVRYPLLSLTATGLAAARDLDAERAWAAAWTDRYGVGPDATRNERIAARAALKRDRKAARRAARSGRLALDNGRLVRVGEPARPDGPADGDRFVPGGSVTDTIAAIETDEGIAEIERYLAANAENGHGALRELPPSGTREEPSEEPPADAPKSRSGGNRARRPRRGSSRAPQSGYPERLARVRLMLTERPDLTGRQVADELGIGLSTAKKLLREARSGDDRP